MSDILTKILASTSQDLRQRQQSRPPEEMRAAAVTAAKARNLRRGIFRAAIEAQGISVIAEVKRASPSKGDIRPDLEVADIVRQYESAGARAISVLTEERHFRGSLADLEEARRATELPILRKDFIIDPYQIWEAASAGADAVLLIAAALAPADLESLMAEARSLGLDVLVEVHDQKELAAAVAAGAPIIGINNRNLKTFEVTLETTTGMIKSVPAGVPVVSESGIVGREDVSTLSAAGVSAVLIGETLMRAPVPADKLKELLSS